MLNGCACQNGGFLGKYFISASILFVACEHLGRLFQPSLKYLQVSQYGVNVYLELVSRPLLSKYRQEMDADKLLIYLQRIYS